MLPIIELCTSLMTASSAEGGGSFLVGVCSFACADALLSVAATWWTVQQEANGLVVGRRLLFPLLK